MPDMKSNNMARGLGYISGVLAKQQTDPLCGKCKSFAMTLGKAKDIAVGFEKSSGGASLSPEMKALYTDAMKILAGVSPADEPVPQRKLGSCKFPENECLLQHSAAFLEKIVE
jgi:hypothetical protein